MNQDTFQAQPDPVEAEAMRRAMVMNQMAELGRKASGGISNFYWIAGMSILNSFMTIFGGGLYFVIGLGATMFIDGVAMAVADNLPEMATLIKVVGLVLTLSASGVFALFGYLGIKGQRWAIITGMVLYSLDTLLLLFFQEWLAVGFHAFFLWGLFGGLNASNQLRQMTEQTIPPSQTGFPANIGS